MKKIISIFAILAVSLSLISCGNKNQSENVNKDTNVTPKKETKTDEKDRVYKQGEQAILKNQAGKDMYSLTINSVKLANNFEYKDEFKGMANQILEVDYTYKNIDQTNHSLSIYGADLQVIDKNGTVANPSDMYPKDKPQSIGKGVNCSVQSYYGLKNASDTVKIMFRSQLYSQSITFEIPVQK